MHCTLYTLNIEHIWSVKLVLQRMQRHVLQFISSEWCVNVSNSLANNLMFEIGMFFFSCFYFLQDFVTLCFVSMSLFALVIKFLLSFHIRWCDRNSSFYTKLHVLTLYTYTRTPLARFTIKLKVKNLNWQISPPPILHGCKFRISDGKEKVLFLVCFAFYCFRGRNCVGLFNAVSV